MQTEQSNIWIRGYPSGDELRLEKFSEVYNNSHYILCWRLIYRVNVGQEMQMKTEPEYFPPTEYEQALQVFQQRGNSEHPENISGLGMSLTEIANLSSKYLENDLLPIKEIAPFQPMMNPYLFDQVRQGLGVTKRLELMFSDVDSETQIPSHVVLVNQNTGRRFFIDLQRFNETLEERIEVVVKAESEPAHDTIETLEDLRRRLNKMSTEELSRPAMAVFSDRTTFTRITNVEMTNVNHPLIKDQQVLVLTKGK